MTDRYVVNRVIDFGGGSRVTVPLEAYATEDEAVGAAKELTAALVALLPRKVDDETTVQQLLLTLGILEADHYVTRMPLKEGNLVKASGGIVLL